MMRTAFQTGDRLAEAGVELAARVGWPSVMKARDAGGMEIRVAGRRLRITLGKAGTTTNTAPLNPAEIAIEAFDSAIGAESGFATVLSPVGREGSCLAAGGIDAIVLGETVSARWVVQNASVSHTRCWFIGLHALCSGIATERDMRRLLEASPRLTFLPEWMKVNDSASLCEYARDFGYDDGAFCDVVVLKAALSQMSGAAWVNAWLAVTEGAVPIAVAEAVGSVCAREVDPTERYVRLRAAAGPGLGARI